MPADGETTAAKPFATRPVYWRQTGWVECPLYRRKELAVGQSVAGPTVVEEYGSTVVVPTGWSVRADAYGNLIVEKTGERA